MVLTVESAGTTFSLFTLLIVLAGERRRQNINIKVHELAARDIVDPTVECDARINLAIQRRNLLCPIILDNRVFHNSLQLMAHARLCQQWEQTIVHFILRQYATLLDARAQITRKVR